MAVWIRVRQVRSPERSGSANSDTGIKGDGLAQLGEDFAHTRRADREKTPSQPLRSLHALDAIRGEQPLAELATKYDVHATQIAQWKADLLKGAEAVFDSRKPPPDTAADLNRLHAKIGQLTLENDFLEGALTKAGLLSAKR